MLASLVGRKYQLFRGNLFLILIICILLCSSLSGCSGYQSAQRDLSPPPALKTFNAVLIEYVKTLPEERKKDQLLVYVPELAIDELDTLTEEFGVERVVSALKLISEPELYSLLQKHGEDYFFVLVRNIVLADTYLDIAGTLFSITGKDIIACAMVKKSRLTGALLLMGDIELSRFATVLNTLSENISDTTFLHSFRDDPYLLLSAIRIIAQRDPDGSYLTEFFDTFTNRERLEFLFTHDLPGLVVAFSTIQEIRSGNDSRWANEVLHITEEHLSRLIMQKPANLAYILYGGYRIGIENFKKIIDEVGRERFAKALENHSSWLADFFTGMNKVTPLSTQVNFKEVARSKAIIKHNYPYLLDYETSLPSQIDKVIILLKNLPNADQYMESESISLQTKIYLLSLLSVYQNIFHETMPEIKLSPLQFELLKVQILHSTRFSAHLNNMISNFEVGGGMLKGNSIETVILLLSHELAHQILSVVGFDSPLLSTASIHECSADIGARAIAQRLNLTVGMVEFREKYVVDDDFSRVSTIKESDLIGKRVPHQIGRTQLGSIVSGFQKSSIAIDWEVLFGLNVAILYNKEKMLYLNFVRDLVGGYTYFAATRKYTKKMLETFLSSYWWSYASESSERNIQMAGSDTVEEMILIARSLLPHADPSLRSSTPLVN